MGILLYLGHAKPFMRHRVFRAKNTAILLLMNGTSYGPLLYQLRPQCHQNKHKYSSLESNVSILLTFAQITVLNFSLLEHPLSSESDNYIKMTKQSKGYLVYSLTLKSHYAKMKIALLKATIR